MTSLCNCWSAASIVVDCLENKQLYFAGRLNDAMKVNAVLPPPSVQCFI